MKKHYIILTLLSFSSTVSIASSLFACAIDTNKEMFFNACEKIDIASLNANFSVARETIMDDIPFNTQSYKIDKNREQSFVDVLSPSTYLEYDTLLHVWMCYYTYTNSWQINNHEESGLFELPQFLKDWYNTNQNKFDWSQIQNNLLNIEISDYEDYDHIEIEFDDNKLFKTILLKQTGPSNVISYGQKYSFEKYNSTQLDNNFPTNYYNQMIINTTEGKKSFLYDYHFDTQSYQSVPNSLKFYLKGTNEKITMWDNTDIIGLGVLKQDGSIGEIPTEDYNYDITNKELTINNSEQHNIKVNDRLFISVTIPANVVENNVRLCCE